MLLEPAVISSSFFFFLFTSLQLRYPLCRNLKLFWKAPSAFGGWGDWNAVAAFFGLGEKIKKKNCPYFLKAICSC